MVISMGIFDRDLQMFRCHESPRTLPIALQRSNGSWWTSVFERDVGGWLVVVVYAGWIWLVVWNHKQWIGLRENLQESPIFNGKIYGFL